jgi:hypothetical protein
MHAIGGGNSGLKARKGTKVTSPAGFCVTRFHGRGMLATVPSGKPGATIVRREAKRGDSTRIGRKYHPT